MRRSRQLLDEKTCVDILARNTSGVLSLTGDDGYPYGVPISYAYSDGRLYFHSAREGHKISAIKHCDKASFTVIDKDEIVPAEYTTYFRSVIAFGRVRLLDNREEIINALRILAKKYSPDESEEHLKKAIDNEISHVAVIELEIEHMTGKEAIELVRMKG